MFLENSPREKSHPESSHSSNSPWEIYPRKILPQKIRGFTSTSSSLDEKFWYLQNSLEFFHETGNINKILVQNILSALSLKSKVSAHDQIAISGYHS